MENLAKHSFERRSPDAELGMVIRIPTVPALKSQVDERRTVGTTGTSRMHPQSFIRAILGLEKEVVYPISCAVEREGIQIQSRNQ